MKEYSASLAAGLDFSLLRWWMKRPAWPSLWGGLILLGGVLAMAGWLKTGVVLGAAGIGGLLLLRRWLAHVFSEGNAVPAMVIDLRPPLVGLLVDLTKDEEGPLAVKVLPYPSRRVLGERLCVGQRVPVACTYCGKENDPLWTDVDPEWLEDGCGDKDALIRLLGKHPEEEWTILDDAVAGLPYRAAGVYRLDGGGLPME